MLTKVGDLMDEASQTGRLPPELAAKLLGCLALGVLANWVKQAAAP